MTELDFGGHSLCWAIGFEWQRLGFQLMEVEGCVAVEFQELAQGFVTHELLADVCSCHWGFGSLSGCSW